MLAKMNFMFVFILEFSPEILAINETWLKYGEESLAPIITNYRFIYKGRAPGEGVGVRKDLTAKVRQFALSLLE